MLPESRAIPPANLSEPRHHDVRLQKGLSRILAPLIYTLVLAWMRLVRRYSIAELNSIRHEFSRRSRESDRPWLICANHLTLIDSFILIWGLGSAPFYMWHPRLFPWNLPEKKNFYHNPFSRALCYFGKCRAVERGAGRETAKRTEDEIDQLVRTGESIMIFPEGTRSRSGFIEPEEVSYASGSILALHPELRVLCVYMRGVGQKGFGEFPRTGEKFRFQLREIFPRTSHSGMRAKKELSLQIITQLKEMEDRHFAYENRNRK